MSIYDVIIKTARNLQHSTQVPVGPVTRARAKKFREALNGLIQATWAQVNSGIPIEGDEQYFYGLIVA